MEKKAADKKYAPFGARLRRLRKANGFTQERAAAQLNVERSTYTKYETGDSMPHQETLLRLAELFRVSVDYLLGNYVEPETPTIKLQDDGTYLGLNPQETAMLTVFRRLTSGQQEAVMNIATNFHTLNTEIKMQKTKK